MTENDKSKVPEKSAITEGGRDSTLESSKLDSQAEPGTLQHVQSMKLLANQDSPSDLSLKCPELSGAERSQIQNNRFEIVDTPKDAASSPESLDSATLMAITAESAPEILPVALLRQYADSLPEGHPDKLRLTDLSRNQAAALSPEFATRYERSDGSVLLDIGIAKDNAPPQNWFEAIQQISELPVQKQFEVIGTALSDGFKQYSYEERERTLGQIIGTVQGVGDVLQFYASISDFANDIIFRREDRLQERGAKFGEALANTYVGGVALFNLAYDYCYNIGFEGDYYKPFRDVVSVANAIDNKWKSLPPREQERIKAQLITNLLADGVITARGAQTISQLPKMTQILDAIAMEAKAAGAVIKNVSGKAANRIATALDDITKFPPGAGGLRPAYAHAGEELASDMVRAGKEAPKGWREKFDELMNAMGGKKENESGLGRAPEAGEPPLRQKTKLSEQLERYKFSTESTLPVVLQQDDCACVFACGEMLSRGKLKQSDLASLFRDSIPSQLKEKNPLPMGTLKFLAEQLEAPWVGGLKSMSCQPEERFKLIQRHNSSWAAEFKVVDESAHIVVVDGYSPSGKIMIRDPIDASKYELELEGFLRFWTLRGVHRNFNF